MPSLSWIQIGVGAIAAFMLSWLLHTLDVNRIETNWQDKLDEQKIALEEQCKADQTITKETNDALQKSYDSIALRLSAAKLRRPTNCVVPATGKAVAAAGGGEHAGQGGAVAGTSDDFNDYFAECEIYRSQRITLEKFIDDTWKAKGQ